MTPIARQFGESRVKRLAMTARGAAAGSQRKQPAHALDFAWLAANDAPALRRMVADLERAPVARHVVTDHIQDDDVGGRDPHDGIPGAAAQRMGAGRADAGPA